MPQHPIGLSIAMKKCVLQAIQSNLLSVLSKSTFLASKKIDIYILIQNYAFYNFIAQAGILFGIID